MEQKERKKKEEAEAKEQRKRDREEKRMLREEEKKKKAVDREKKLTERRKKAEEREETKRKKAEAREAERRRKTELKLANKENRSRHSKGGLQKAEISSNECAACFGLYEDDFIDGQLVQEWIQCTDLDCGKWMHINCLDTDSKGDMYICSVCKNIFC